MAITAGVYFLFVTAGGLTIMGNETPGVASANAAGTLNFGGGAKDSGGRVADALLGPDTDYGRKIRGW